MKNNLFNLKQIAKAITNIEQFLDAIDYGEFQTNRMMVDAVAKELENIGEAANSVSDKFRLLHPEMPWDKMIDMRNFLVHEYFGIREDIVWDTCKNDLPKLKKQLVEILE